MTKRPAGDPGASDPPAVYYYEWDRKALKFSRYTVAAEGEDIALGRQYSVTDVNKDGRPDILAILAPGKHSFWIFLNEGCR